MKLKIILILVLFLSNYFFSQVKDWFAYDLDSIVSLEMPFTVYELDTIIEYNKFYQIYSDDNTSKFIVQKAYMGKLYSNIETPILPNNAKSLKKYYLEIIAILNEMIEYD
jgi:hypothetical protein